MNLLDAEVLPEIDPVGPRDRRAWFALRMRPRVPASEPGVQFVLAIDRSSSMRGDKLEQARLAATVLIEMLRAEDELAILAFDEHVRVMLPPQRADWRGKNAARLVIAGMQAGRGTALHGAAQQSLALANQLSHGHAILITDGFPYTGITDAAKIIAMVGEEAGLATLTTIGVGSELDASLLAAMAGVGGGRFLHVDAGGDLVGTVGGELATVRGAVTGRVQLCIRGARGVAIATAPHYASVRTTSDGRSVLTATLAPAVDGEERLVAFELAWERELGVGAHQVALVTVEVGLPGSTSAEHLELPVRLA
ncbi:MAG: VWA domain-containing protein, partial [Myxococcota bacterium]|nr:VWA domain-containing protein [Myxococcota bacterium]